MTNEAAAPGASGAAWQAKQVYVMAAVCLGVGLAIGYFFRGSQPPAASTAVAAQPANKSAAAPSGMSGSTPSLEQMKHMAEKKAEPLLAKLKTNPNDAALWIQVGDIYRQTHQFRDAADYYRRSLQIDPKNAGVRSDLASALYYSGDVDGALGQLQEALRYDAKNAAALFNLGMIRWQGKKDGKGAVAAWQELLKTNPQLDAGRKTVVEKLIADAKQQSR
jgi:cytochrome c-type biogenesis protein CcmH/NrfG